MPLNKSQIVFLENSKNKGFVHASNFLAKKEDKDIDIFFNEYKRFNQAISNDIATSVNALNRYKDFVLQKSNYSAQSKFSSTIIEEFICRVLKNSFGNGVLLYGSVKAYSSLYFSYPNKSAFKSDVDIKINVKDQDVGIYKKEILINKKGKHHEVYIPIVCIECKTYRVV